MCHITHPNVFRYRFLLGNNKAELYSLRQLFTSESHSSLTKKIHSLLSLNVTWTALCHSDVSDNCHNFHFRISSNRCLFRFRPEIFKSLLQNTHTSILITLNACSIVLQLFEPVQFLEWLSYIQIYCMFISFISIDYLSNSYKEII